MLRRLAHLVGFRKKDEALEKRFAQIKTRYLESVTGDGLSDAMGQLRITGSFDKRTITGGSKVTKERMTQTLLESYARSADRESELVGSGV